MMEVVEYSAEDGKWPNSEDDYDLGDVIGIGSIAIVHIADCKPRKEKCAIKRIDLEKWTIEKEKIKEIEALINYNHKNVVNYYTSFVVGEEIWLVMRLLKAGSLLDIIANYAQTEECECDVFNEITIATVLRKVLKGLRYLHERGQIHKEIKTENILLSLGGNIQISGFGLNAWLADNDASQNPKPSVLRTQCWIAPEVKEMANGYDFKTDIWNFGLVAIELATGRSPFHRYYQMEESMLATPDNPFTIEFDSEENLQKNGYGKLLRDMISSCLQTDPEKRPTADELLQHSFFKNAKKKKFLKQTLLPLASPLTHRALRIIFRTRFPETNLWHFEKETAIWMWFPGDTQNIKL